MSRTVFIVEDDVDTREMLGRFLELEGYEVESAPNGKAALERLDAGSPACVILLDLMMPEMDGFQVVEALRERDGWRSIPIVVVTAKNLTAEDHSRLNGYVEKILQKGAYSREALLAEIRDLVTAYIARQES